MSANIVEIKNYSVRFGQNEILHHISMHVPQGKIVAIVGESGSGKSITSLSLLQLLQGKNLHTEGQIYFGTGEQKIDIVQADEKTMENLRGVKIGMIFQEPMTALNPVITCGEQVAECLILHKKISRKEAKAATIRLFEQVELPHPAQLFDRYPHEISGGQKQRVMIAMAVSCQPDLLICDEPTTALDVMVQKNILLLIKDLQKKLNISVIFISHDLNIVADFADYIYVMYKGNIVESGKVKDIFEQPKEPYTKALIACRPALYAPDQILPTVPDFLQNPDFVPQKNTLPKETPDWDNPILDIQNLNVWFPTKQSFFGKVNSWNKAINGLSVKIYKGETVGLVGGSGCGKTTLGRTIIGLTKAHSGQIFFQKKDLLQYNHTERQKSALHIQYIFQDPFSSLNPALTIGDAIAEAMIKYNICSKKEARPIVEKWLQKVGLQAAHYDRYPHEFSGGQRQRIVIARALVLQPDFVICDESVSALDVSVQAQVLNLLNDLKRELKFTCLFISHDLSVVKYISDRIIVMEKGQIVEIGNAQEVYAHPKNEYTKALLQAVV